MRDLHGMAEIILRRYQELYPEIMLFDTWEDQEVDNVARVIDDYIPPELSNRFMNDDLGYGIILGLVSGLELMHRERELGYEDEDEDEFL